MPSKDKKAFPLRLDPDVHRALEKWAADEFRSVNAHIEFLLREALRKAGRLKPDRPPAAGEAEERE
ncbi:Arc family DNA-binding protein [Paenibacillus glycinis]|uniref:Arc family DNA-binding protein n=1 Tax=Paenibacillus glycinis TaxID=2697035 RepID=A0ABW9XR74_9BACL|nr:Arc family DNA-binding protein [Paenibacillus glycinis]NBD24911.1 Arc family DNA-binding protein [Paenibacillus glycinis]